MVGNGKVQAVPAGWESLPHWHHYLVCYTGSQQIYQPHCVGEHSMTFFLLSISKMPYLNVLNGKHLKAGSVFVLNLKGPKTSLKTFSFGNNKMSPTW